MLEISKAQGLLQLLQDAKTAQTQLDVLKELGGRLHQLGYLKDRIELVEAEIYYTVSKCWDTLDDSIKEKWSDFYAWATQYSLKGASGISSTTIDNKIRVFRLWLSPEATIVPPSTVYKEGDGEEYEEFEFDAAQVPYSKLLVATGAANRGEMPEAAWAALVDTESTTRDIRDILVKAQRQTQSELDQVDTALVFNGGGILYYREYGLTVAFAQILYENKENPLFTKIVNRLLQVFGLEPDIGRIEAIGGNQPVLIRPDEDELMVNYRGQVFAQLTLEEAKELRDQLVDFFEDQK